jgi:hypothetical protein
MASLRDVPLPASCGILREHQARADPTDATSTATAAATATALARRDGIHWR